MDPNGVLLAMDFDNTIIDGDCDEETASLSPCIPDDLRAMKQWTDNALYMDTVLKVMKDQGIGSNQILKNLRELRLAPGMRSLLRQVRSRPGMEAIIISNANTLFIRTVLNSKNLESVFGGSVYSNHGWVHPEKDRVHVKPYHDQDFCALCPRNLCKGSVLMEHLAARSSRGLRTSRIIYVGDGANDFCPCTKLGSNDIIFCRKSFELEKLLACELSKNNCRLYADVRFYSHACHVWEALKWPRRPSSSITNSSSVGIPSRNQLRRKQKSSTSFFGNPEQ